MIDIVPAGEPFQHDRFAASRVSYAVIGHGYCSSCDEARDQD